MGALSTVIGVVPWVRPCTYLLPISGTADSDEFKPKADCPSDLSLELKLIGERA